MARSLRLEFPGAALWPVVICQRSAAGHRGRVTHRAEVVAEPAVVHPRLLQALTTLRSL